MDTTPVRGYPFPECDPPRVKDAADMPQQLRALARAIDADLTVINAAVSAAVDMPSVDMERTTNQTPANLALMSFDTVIQAQGITPDTVNGAFTVHDTGLYMITSSFTATTGPTQASNLALQINGQVRYIASTDPNPFNTATVLGNAIQQIVLLQAEDVVNVSQSSGAVPPLTYNYAHLAAVMLARIS